MWACTGTRVRIVRSLAAEDNGDQQMIEVMAWWSVDGVIEVLEPLAPARVHV